MKQNMGIFDRILRMIIAVTIIELNVKGLIPGGWAVLAIIISVVFLLTGMLGFCPVYKLFGKKSRNTN